jgi:hypothetical protein
MVLIEVIVLWLGELILEGFLLVGVGCKDLVGLILGFLEGGLYVRCEVV